MFVTVRVRPGRGSAEFVVAIIGPTGSQEKRLSWPTMGPRRNAQPTTSFEQAQTVAFPIPWPPGAVRWVVRDGSGRLVSQGALRIVPRGAPPS